MLSKDAAEPRKGSKRSELDRRFAHEDASAVLSPLKSLARDLHAALVKAEEERDRARRRSANRRRAIKNLELSLARVKLASIVRPDPVAALVGRWHKEAAESHPDRLEERTALISCANELSRALRGRG